MQKEMMAISAHIHYPNVVNDLIYYGMVKPDNIQNYFVKKQIITKIISYKYIINETSMQKLIIYEKIINAIFDVIIQFVKAKNKKVTKNSIIKLFDTFYLQINYITDELCRMQKITGHYQEIMIADNIQHLVNSNVLNQLFA